MNASSDGSDASPLARASAALVRTTSRTLAGGAYPSFQRTGTTERTPIRQSSRDIAAQTHDQIQQRVVEELFTGSGLPFRLLIFFVVLVFVLVGFGITVLVLCIRAVIDTINYADKPCDQPLQYYMLVSLLYGWLGQGIFKVLVDKLPLCCCDSIGCQVCFKHFIIMMPSAALLGWGVYMLQHADTCSTTNPGLYYPLRDYIYCQLIFTMLCFIFAVLCAIGGFALLIMFQNAWDNRPGCEKSVRKLPKVDPDSPELIDEEGNRKACPICIDSPGVWVRTPCNHIFHEECLANWCKHHFDCPLCRAPIGEIDEETGDAKG